MRIWRTESFVANHYPSSRVPNRFFGTQNFPYCKLGGIRDFKAKFGPRFGVESMLVRWDAKNNRLDTGLHEIWGPNDGIEKPYW